MVLRILNRSLHAGALAVMLMSEATGQPAATPAPAPATAGSGSVRLENYVLRPGDQIEIRVFREDNLTTRTQVAQDGTITFPLIGQVKVGGRTITEAQREISQALDKDFIVNPQVGIALIAYARQRITILGQVKKPGIYNIPAEEALDLIQAIGLAGGYGQYAAETKVMLRRIEDGKETVYRLNAREMARGREKLFQVRAGDVITVGESLF